MDYGENEKEHSQASRNAARLSRLGLYGKLHKESAIWRQDLGKALFACLGALVALNLRVDETLMICWYASRTTIRMRPHTDGDAKKIHCIASSLAAYVGFLPAQRLTTLSNRTSARFPSSPCM